MTHYLAFTLFLNAVLKPQFCKLFYFCNLGEVDRVTLDNPPRIVTANTRLAVYTGG